MLDVALCYVMGRLLLAIQRLEPAASFQGTCDLAIGDENSAEMPACRTPMDALPALLLNMQLSWWMIFCDIRLAGDYRSGRPHGFSD